MKKGLLDNTLIHPVAAQQPFLQMLHSRVCHGCLLPAFNRFNVFPLAITARQVTNRHLQVAFARSSTSRLIEPVCAGSHGANCISAWAVQETVANSASVVEAPAFSLDPKSRSMQLSPWLRR